MYQKNHRRLDRYMASSNGQPPETVAVVGSGLIGASWTALFLAHGVDVRAWDPNLETLRTLHSRVRSPMRQLRQLGCRGRGNLLIERRLDTALAGVKFIQENAPEKLELKHELYEAIEATVGRSILIASSTSSMTWSALSAKMRHPERLIVAHPFNPPHLVPLVELYAVTAKQVSRARSFYERVGKTVVVLKKEAPGHVANRLASALWREAVYIVAEGIADVADVDLALVNGPGIRWAATGAHMTYHLGGGPGGIESYLKHLGPSQERRWQSLGSPTLSPTVQRQLIDGVRIEAAGRSIDELERERDKKLIRILRARK
jgi:carnitine 3-dehydrogenase